MRVLVTGATGFIGKQLLLGLRNKGHDIVVLTRDPRTAKERLPVSCHILPWEPALGPPPLEAFQKAQAVIHLAGAGVAQGRWTAERKQEIADSRILSTRHLVQAMKKLEHKPKVFISASAIGYYGPDNGTIMREDAPPGTGFLADVCRKWEEEAFHAEGIRTVVLRLAFVVGRNSVAMNRMLPVFRMGLGGQVGNGKQPMSWIHVQDAMGIILHALETSSIKGAYNAASPNTVSNAEFTQTMAKTLNRPAFLSVPTFALKLALGEMSQLLLTSPNISADKVLQTGYSFRYATLPDALKAICLSC